VYEHPRKHEKEHVGICRNHLRDGRDIPAGAYLPDHAAGSIPGHLVSGSRVEVGPAAEEQPREGNESESLRDAPGDTQPLEAALPACKMVHVPEQCHGGHKRHPHEEQIENRRGEKRPKQPQRDGDGQEQQRTHVPVHVLPELISYGSKPVESAPYYEVPAGSVPQAAKQHGYETVDVGDDILAPGGVKQGDYSHHSSEGQDSDADPETPGKPDSQHCKEDYPEVSAESSVPVASERNVQVRLQPAAQRHVPAAPEILRVCSLVGGIEVLRKTEAHEQGHAYGNVGIAGKVGIYLKRIGEYGAKVLETGKQQRVVKYPVNEVDSYVVAQDYLLHQSVQYPENRQAELAPAYAVRLVELGDELAGTNNRTRDQLGKKRHIEAEVEYVVNRLELSAIHVYGIAQDLEGEEGYSDRQYDGIYVPNILACKSIACKGEHIHDLDVNAENRAGNVCEKVGVLEIAEYEQVGEYAAYQPEFLPPLRRGPIYPAGNEEVRTYYKEEYQDRKAAGLVVEKQAYKEKKAVPEKSSALDESEKSEYNGKEGPEIELSEQEGRT